MLSTDISPFPTSMTSESSGHLKLEALLFSMAFGPGHFSHSKNLVHFRAMTRIPGRKKADRELIEWSAVWGLNETHKWGQMLRPRMVFAKVAAIGQCSLSHYSSFVEQNQTLSPGMFSDVNRWVDMFRWFLPSLVFMFHIISWAHFNQNAAKPVARWGVFWLKWRLSVTQDYLQPPKTRSRRKLNHFSGTFRASGVGSFVQIYIFYIYILTTAH